MGKSVLRNSEQISKLKYSSLIRTLIPFLGLILVCIVFGIATEGKFTSSENMLLILSQSVAVMIAGTGVSFVVTMGSLDLSSGSVAAISAALGAIALKSTGSVALFFIIIIGTALIAGTLNGILLTKLKIPSFILTISILFMYRGLAVVACAGGTIPIPLWMRAFDVYDVKFGILIIILAAFVYLFNLTKLGFYCKSIGSGEKAAKYSGVPVNKIKITAFMISGVLAGVAAFILLVRSGSVTTRTGIFLETDILTSLVLGSMPLTGGSGSKITSIIIGAFLLMAFSNGLLLVGSSDKMLQLLKGLLFLITVAISFDRKGTLVIK